MGYDLFSNLSDKQKQNAVLILDHLFYLYKILLKKTEKFDPFLQKNVWCHYLCINDNNYPISQEDFECFRVLGIDVVII